jgi:2-oxoglutarate dehydrogenase E2 component (dihydrolipoamide succinyltransferase)
MSEQIEILMPSMGEGITEATLVKWLKKKGDEVRKDEPLLEVSTDKVDTEIPSPASGFLLETTAAEGETVSVNAVIAFLGENGATPVAVKKRDPSARPQDDTKARPQDDTKARPQDDTKARPQDDVKTRPQDDVKTRPQDDVKTRPQDDVKGTSRHSEPSEESRLSAQAATRHSEQSEESRPASPRPAAAVPAMPAFTASGPVKSSPLVRKIARSKNVDLSRVPGTGMHGRITKTDIESYLAHGPAAYAPAAPAPAASGTTTERGPSHLEYGRLQTKRDTGGETLEGVPVRREKMSKMRGLIAEHMVRSVRTSPHVTTIFEMDLHKVVGAREKYREAFATKEGFNLTYTPFFVWAAVQAIKENPIVNVSVDGEDILWKDDINIGVAVALENGLIVPVIRKAGELNFTGVARRMNDLVVRARSKKLTPEDVQGGTFSITNPGMFGSIVSSPIINQPQVAIMSIGAIIKRPVVINDMIAFRPLCQIGLTFDHRVVDGDGGARYLASLKKHLESFNETIV